MIAWLGLLQVDGPHEDQKRFFDVWMFVLILVPIAVAMLLAASRKRAEPPLPHVRDEDFDSEVLQAPRPVLVHFYRTWGPGDRVMMAQVKRLMEKHAATMDVWWLDIEQNPVTAARFPHIQPPAFLYFVGGICIYHGEGVHDEVDIVREMAEAERTLTARRSEGRPFGFKPRPVGVNS